MFDVENHFAHMRTADEWGQRNEFKNESFYSSGPIRLPIVFLNGTLPHEAQATSRHINDFHVCLINDRQTAFIHH